MLWNTSRCGLSTSVNPRRGLDLDGFSEPEEAGALHRDLVRAGGGQGNLESAGGSGIGIPRGVGAVCAATRA